MIKNSSSKRVIKLTSSSVPHIDIVTGLLSPKHHIIMLTNAIKRLLGK